METKISHLFKEQDVNISEFARRTGVPYGTMYDIAKGKTPLEKIGIGTFIKIATAFGMSAEELLGDTDIDPKRNELCEIYDDLGFDGRRALIACARGLVDEYREDGLDEARIDIDLINGER